MSRPVDLRALLERLGPKPRSGQDLARSLGLTRAGVWKQIRMLQAMRFPVKMRPQKGYFLDVPAPVPLLSLRITKPLSHWAKPHVELSATSTQTLAKRAAHAGAPEGQFWISEVQSEGRGRLGRQWDSGFGGLWWSLILRPQVPPSRSGTIAMMASLVLAETITAETGLPAKLKWPNDVMLPVKAGLRKVAGFLTGMSGEMNKTEWIVLGMGVNVHNCLPEALQHLGATLGQEGKRPVVREKLLVDYLKRFHSAYRLWQRSGFDPFLARYWSRYFAPDQPVRLRTAAGLVTGTARRVDASGAIIVESRRKTRAVFEGDIVL